MSIRSSVRSLIIVASFLGSTGLAFARNPPALVRLQQAAQVQDRVAPGSGYRDSLARSSADVVPEGKLGNAAGYRDSLTRFAARVRAHGRL